MFPNHLTGEAKAYFHSTVLRKKTQSSEAAVAKFEWVHLSSCRPVFPFLKARGYFSQPPFPSRLSKFQKVYFIGTMSKQLHF